MKMCVLPLLQRTAFFLIRARTTMLFQRSVPFRLLSISSCPHDLNSFQPYSLHSSITWTMKNKGIGGIACRKFPLREHRLPYQTPCFAGSPVCGEDKYLPNPKRSLRKAVCPMKNSIMSIAAEAVRSLRSVVLSWSRLIVRPVHFVAQNQSRVQDKAAVVYILRI